MSLYKTFKTDSAAERDGVWKDFPPNYDKTVPAFLLARMAPSNPEYLKRIEATAKAYKTEINLDIFTEEQAFEPMLDVFVDTILLDWRNIYDADNKVMEYSKDNAKKLLRDLPDLYTLLREYASRITTFRAVEIEGKAGN